MRSQEKIESVNLEYGVQSATEKLQFKKSGWRFFEYISITIDFLEKCSYLRSSYVKVPIKRCT